MAAHDFVDSAQRFRSGLPAEASLDDKLAFATLCLQNYRVQEQSGDSLSEYFADAFAGFKEKEFKSVDPDTCRNLWDLLRTRGIFVPKGRNVPSADVLNRVAQEDLPWPDGDYEKLVKQATLPSHREQAKIGDLIEEKNNSAIGGHVARVKEVQYDTKIYPAEQFDTASRPLRRSNMANLYKAYSGDDENYSCVNSANFEWKLLLCVERYDEADILDEDWKRAFFVMLAGHATQFYFDSLEKKDMSLVESEDAIKSRFLTAERTRELLRKLEALSFTSIISLHETDTLCHA